MVSFGDELQLVMKILLSGILGAIIGLERERHGHDAGIRTYASLTIGSCTFGIISIHAAELFSSVEPSRIAAQIVSGVGFLGAGVILRDRGKIMGLTTAAALWTSAAIGLAVAFNMYLLSVTCTIVLFLILLAHNLRIGKENGDPDNENDVSK